MVTLGDMLARAEDFETRLEDFYADLRDRSNSDGVRLLTFYLARHRKHLPDALEMFEDRQIRRWKQVPLKYDDTDFDPRKLFQNRHLSEDANAQKVLDNAIELIENLIRFYRWMTMHPLSKAENELFETLLQIEQSHIVELKKIRALDYF